MEASKNGQSMLIAAAGICTQFGAWIYFLVKTEFGVSSQGVALNSWIIYAAGSALMVWGLAINAKGKWQSPWWGLLGVFSFLGAVIVALQPDLHKIAERDRLVTNSISEVPGEHSVSFYCQTCQYQLNGITGNTCPECGRPFDPNDLDTVSIAGKGLNEAPWMGRWSLICGIMGIVLSLGITCGPILGLTGIAFGHSALFQIKRNRLDGFGVALAGLIVSYFALLLSGVAIYGLFLL